MAQADTIRLVAAVLTLQNIEFGGGGAGTAHRATGGAARLALAAAADLLGVEARCWATHGANGSPPHRAPSSRCTAESVHHRVAQATVLEGALTNRTITTGGVGKRSSVIRTPLVTAAE